MSKDKISYIFLKNGEIEIPAIKIVDSFLIRDVKICCRDKKDLHFSLHPIGDGQILRTIYDYEKGTRVRNDDQHCHSEEAKRPRNPSGRRFDK